MLADAFLFVVFIFLKYKIRTTSLVYFTRTHVFVYFENSAISLPTSSLRYSCSYLLQLQQKLRVGQLNNYSAKLTPYNLCAIGKLKLR